jgi:hypothetical protein
METEIVKTKLARLRPFEEIIAENTRTNNDMTRGGTSWNIYHPVVTKCLTVLDEYRKYFDDVVRIWPNDKINKIINNSDQHYMGRSVYKAEVDGVIFDVYDHWVTDIIDYLPEELFDI